MLKLFTAVVEVQVHFQVFCPELPLRTVFITVSSDDCFH